MKNAVGNTVARKKLVDYRHIVFLDCHTGEYPGYKCFAQFDAKQIVGEAVRAGADAISFFSKDHFGNCFCDLPGGHRHKDVHGDYTGAVVDEAKRRGLGVCVYYSVYADRREGMKHPDWEPQNADYRKNFLKGFPWRTLCHNSPFTDEVFIPHITTVVRRYRPMAVFLDPMNFAGVCTCKGCRTAWKEMYGRAMNVRELEANPRAWTTFFHATWNRAFQRAYDACHEIDPNIEFVFGPRHDDPDLAGEVEAICPFEGAETNLCYVNADTGILTPGLLGRMLRTRNLPASLTVNSFNGCWGEATVKNATLLTTELAATHANGLRYMMAEYLRSWGKVEPEAFNVIAEAFKAEDPFTEISVDCLAPRHIAVLDNNGFPSNQCAAGAGKLLVEAHQQFDFIEETVLENLDGYKVLWAPPIELWRDQRWGYVLEWVREGGTLMMEANEQLTKSPGLKAILKQARIGAVKPSKFSALYFLPDKANLDERHGAMPIMLHEPSWRIEAGKAKRVIDVADPAAEWNPDKGIVFRMNVIHPDLGTRHAGVVEGAVGKGSVIVLPAAVSRAYYQHNYTPLRRMIARLIAAKAPVPFEADIPPYVEVNMLTKQDSTILHLVQYCLNHGGGNDAHNSQTNPGGMWCGERYLDIEDVRPLFDVAIKVRCGGKPKAVIAYPEMKKLPFTFKGGFVEFVLPRLDLHAAVRIDQ